jgi:CHAD domain-containing protein
VLADVLTRAGAEPSSSASKLARALGPLPAVQDHTIVGGTAAMLQAALAEHRDLLLAQDPLVRVDAVDSVHQMRVATRRIRSTLKAYQELFDKAAAKKLDRELKWLAAVLGEPRDAEVMAERLAGLIAGQPAGSVPDSLRERLVDAQLLRYETTLAAALESMSSTRYYRLLDALDAAIAEPPFAGTADVPISAAVRTAVGRVHEQLRATDKAARELPAGTRAHDELLHEVRKHAKQLRYTTELALGADGCPKEVREASTGIAKAAKKLQEQLGNHQDGCITADHLRASKRKSDTPAERRALKALLKQEESLAATARKGYRPLAKEVRGAVKTLG